MQDKVIMNSKCIRLYYTNKRPQKNRSKQGRWQRMAFTSNNDSKMTKTNMEYDNCTPMFQNNIMETF